MRLLESQINNSTDTDMISKLKQKHTEYDIELRRLKKLRWEDETQYIDMDDDR